MPRQRRVLSNLSEKVAEKYYTAQQAQKRLGMTRDMFNHHVKQGTIKKHILVGSHGYYIKAEIDSMAEKLEFALLTADITTLEYRPAVLSDIDELTRMAYLNFGELSRSPERIAARKKFLEINPNSTFVLQNYHTLVAAFDIIPMKHEAILRFREGERGWQLPEEDIEQFEPGHRLECITIDMMTTTNAPKGKREYYASTLLRRFALETLIDWGNKGIDVKSIDACGAFEDGHRILQSAGFVSLGLKGKREIFTLDIDSSELKPLIPYKNALASSKK